MTDKLRDLLREVKEKGLIYWEPNTTRGHERKAEMISRIDLALAAAPQPAPVDRKALVEVLRPYVGAEMAHAQADALLARGLRLPSVDVNETTVHSHQGGLMCADDRQTATETMAWAVAGEDN